MSLKSKAIALMGGADQAPAPVSGPTPVVDLNGNSALANGVAQIVSSLNGNSSFKIKQTLTANTNEIDFSRSSSPPLVRPMNNGPTWQEFDALQDSVEALTRRVDRTRRAHVTRHEAENDYLGTPQGPMSIDGQPGFVFLDASGRYVAYRITEHGLEYAREVKRNK
jgi:hypothetical protein